MTGPLIINNQDLEPWAVKVDQKPVLNLKYRAFDHRIRNLRVIGTWLMDDPGKQPCMVIVPAGVSLPKTTPCVVPLNHGHLWAEETCDEIEAATMAIEFCVALGLNPASTKDILQVLATVRDRLHDLILMPPTPPMDKELAGHLIIGRSDQEEPELKEVFRDV